MSNQSRPVTALPRPLGLGRDVTPSRPPLNWSLIAVWTTGLVVSLAVWVGIAVAIMALIG